MCRVLKENGPYCAIHCHNSFEAALCICAAKKAKIPVRISHSHIKHIKSNFIKNIVDSFYLRLINKNATHKIGCSNEACNTFFGENKGAVTVVNPYNDAKFNSEKYKKKFFDFPVLTQIGNFSSNKNQLFSLSVIRKIKKTYPSVKLNLVGFEGETGFLDIIKNEINKLELEENVLIHSSDADTPLLLSESTGFLFPSVNEGFGIVLIEAQAMGVSCYASNSVPKNTDCGGCTYLPLSDSGVWAEKIINDFKENGGRHGRYDCSRFSAESVMKVYKDIYGGKCFENRNDDISQSK